jgi:two-component system OmpR family response regulator
MLLRPVACPTGADAVSIGHSGVLNSVERTEGPGRTTRVLLIDNDETLHRQVQDYLETFAMRVSTSALHGDAVERLLAAEAPDVIVVHLPPSGNDWINLLRRKRPRCTPPAIIAIGHADKETERVAALELGADAYFTKPYGLRELVARIRAIVRRDQMDRNVGPRRAHFRRCRFGGWELDRQTRCLTAIDGAQCELTKGEYALLLAFLNTPECPLTREHLLDAIRVHEDVFDRAIDVRVLRLRRKLAAGSNVPPVIQTVHGVGYSLAVSVEWA